MTQMRVFQFPERNGALVAAQKPMPSVGDNDVLIKVKACGVCHSDAMISVIASQYPRVPGHEIAGVVEKVGARVTLHKVGDRVGAGWHGGHCGTCNPCLRGKLFACELHAITGATMDGGFAEYVALPQTACAPLPDGLSFVEAAPILCAGLTTFNGIRNAGATPGSLVAVLGLGGLGHLAVQFASKLGFLVAVIARGQGKKDDALRLGAKHYIDSTAEDPAAALQALGGASLIVSTVTSSKAMAAVVGGLDIEGTLLLLGIDQTVELPIVPLVTGSRSVKGWYSGTARDSADTLKFCLDHGVRSANEVFSFADAPKAMDKMLSGAVRHRAVLSME